MAKVEILAAAHFYSEGARGARGGAASNDKVWGIARIQGTLVRFWGRRNGVMKFKTEIFGVGAVRNKLHEKLDKGYMGMGPNSMAALVPNLERDLPSHYFRALSLGRVNTQH